MSHGWICSIWEANLRSFFHPVYFRANLIWNQPDNNFVWGHLGPAQCQRHYFWDEQAKQILHYDDMKWFILAVFPFWNIFYVFVCLFCCFAFHECLCITFMHCMRMCVCVYCVHTVHSEVRRRHHIPWNWSFRCRWATKCWELLQVLWASSWAISSLWQCLTLFTYFLTIIWDLCC